MKGLGTYQVTVKLRERKAAHHDAHHIHHTLRRTVPVAEAHRAASAIGTHASFYSSTLHVPGFSNPVFPCMAQQQKAARHTP